MSACPPMTTLQRWLADELDDAERVQFVDHIDQCERCKHSLTDLQTAQACADEPTVLIAGPSNVPFPPPADFLRFLKANNPLVQDNGAEPTGGQEPDTLHFPGPPTAHGPLGQLESYHFLEQLGCGATGYVYKAFEEGLDRVVAVKFLRPELAASERGRAAFLREGKAAAAVRHPGVVTVHLVGRSDHFALPYLVMEYVEGGSLKHWLQARAKPQPREAVAIVRQAALGLDQAHQCGVIHRDVKPSNLLVGSDGQIKVGDFGLARVLQTTTAGQRLPEGNSIVGTPAYMSPEQIQAPDQVDQRSDVYGLGAILYELLTGQPPFQGDLLETLRQVKQEVPVWPLQLDPTLPYGLAAIAIKCLAKEPSHRYPDAKSLADDLQRWLDAAPIQARPPSRLSRVSSWCRRNPTLASAWCIAAAAGVALAVVSVLFALHDSDVALRLREEQAHTDAARSEARRWQTVLALERGLALCEQGEAEQGMHWLTRSLETVPADADDLQQTIRWQLAAWRHEVHTLKTVLPHGYVVYATAFSSDGRLVLTGGEEHVAKLWDAATGKPKPSIAPFLPGSISSLAFGPDEQQVLLGVKGWRAILFETATGRILRDFREAADHPPLRIMACSPDTRTLVTVYQDGTAQLWDIPNGLPIRPRQKFPAPIESAAISPDGKLLATGGADCAVRLWETATGKPVGKPLPHQSDIAAISFSPDGRIVLSGSKDHTARLWEVASCQPLGPPLQHKDKVYDVAFHPNGRSVLTGSKDHTARLWDVATGQPIGSAMQHDGIVFAVAFSPDGKLALTAGSDGSARLWEIALERPTERLLAEVVPVLDFGSDNSGCAFLRAEPFAAKPIQEPFIGLYAVTDEKGRVGTLATAEQLTRLAEVGKGKPLAFGFMHQAAIRSLAFSPDGRTMLTGSTDKTARLCELTTGHSIGTPMQHANAVTAVAFHPKGKMFLTGCWDGTAQLWDAATYQAIGTPVAHRGPVIAVAFSGDGRYFATASRDTTAQVWDTATRQRIGQPLRHAQAVQSVAFGPDSRLVATGSEDKTARLWLTASGQPLGPALQHTCEVTALAFSRDGRSLITASVPRVVHVWRVPLERKKGLEGGIFHSIVSEK